MDVVWRPGKSDAEMSNMVFKLFCKSTAFSIQLAEAFDGFLCLLFEPCHIDSEELFFLHDHLACNQYGVDGRGVFCVDQLVDRIIEGKPVDLVEVQQRDISFVPRLD